MFIDDPSERIIPVENAWKEYVLAGESVYQQILDQVQQSRFAPDSWHYLPCHPFAHLFDVGDHSPWRPRPIRYVETAEDNRFAVRHGLDGEGRVVIAGNRIVVYGDGYHDILLTRRLKDSATGELTDRRVVYESGVDTGHPEGRVTRFFTDADGHIQQSVCVCDEGEEPEYHYRILETFCWDGDRLVESFGQSFQRGRDESDDDPSTVRRVNDQLWESLYMRRRTEFSYDDSGRLAKVAEYTPEGQPGEVYYTYNPNDTVEGLSDELVKLLGSHLVKAIKGVEAAHPVRWAAASILCRTCTLRVADGTVADERRGHQSAGLGSLPAPTPWPPAGRVGEKYEDLHRRLQLVVEGLPEYADDFQPRPYREVLWRASRHVYDALVGKRVTANGFAVFPIDDHGDVDPYQDVRESLPSDIAEQVIQHVNKAEETL